LIAIEAAANLIIAQRARTVWQLLVDLPRWERVVAFVPMANNAFSHMQIASHVRAEPV